MKFKKSDTETVMKSDPSSGNNDQHLNLSHDNEAFEEEDSMRDFCLSSSSSSTASCTENSRKMDIKTNNSNGVKGDDKIINKKTFDQMSLNLTVPDTDQNVDPLEKITRSWPSFASVSIPKSTSKLSKIVDNLNQNQVNVNPSDIKTEHSDDSTIKLTKIDTYEADAQNQIIVVVTEPSESDLNSNDEKCSESTDQLEDLDTEISFHESSTPIKDSAKILNVSNLSEENEDSKPEKINRESKIKNVRSVKTIYNIPVWSKKDHNKNSVHQETGSKNIEMIAHRRRTSSFYAIADKRRGSVKNIIFGDPNFCRRFSQDLRVPKFPGEEIESDETAKVIFFQVFIPFLIAGFGNVGAGVVLDYVQRWDVFLNISELFILVASFLGFKGNLEMTLAARLSTQANLGNMDKLKEQWQIGWGNVALIQSQAIVVAFLAALIAILSNFMKNFTFNFESALLICATSLFTASITGLFLASLMVIVIILARKTGVNPDNVSTLIAAFTGDITAVILLSGSARLLYDYRHMVWLSPAVIGGFVAVLPISLFLSWKNKYTRDIVGAGWFPIIIAMVISSIGGFIFDFAVGYFQTIAIFQPIINGVGSNLVAVQASRISTYYHQRVPMGELPLDEKGRKTKICQNPLKAFFGVNPNVRTAKLLLLMAIPGHIIYIVTIRLIKSEVSITAPFLFLYLTVAVLQVFILLYIAHLLVPFLWKKKIDPDNSAIPGIMATGDLIGTTFLTVAYIILYTVGDANGAMHPDASP